MGPSGAFRSIACSGSEGDRYPASSDGVQTRTSSPSQSFVNAGVPEGVTRKFLPSG